jgi:hypothetical protein
MPALRTAGFVVLAITAAGAGAVTATGRAEPGVPAASHHMMGARQGAPFLRRPAE